MKKLKNAAKFLSILLLLLAAVTFGAIAADADTFVARVGENRYTSLEDAIAAAEDGDTVYVLADTTLDRTPITKSITLESAGTGRYTVTLVDKTTVGGLTGIGGLPMVGVVAKAPEMITVAADAVLNIRNIVLNAEGAADRPMGVYGVLGVAGSAEIIGNEHGEVLLASDTSLRMVGDFTGAIKVDLKDVADSGGVLFGVNDGGYRGCEKITSAENPSLCTVVKDGKLVFTMPSGDALKYMNLCLDGQIGVKLYYDLSAALKDGSFNENTVLAFYIGETLIDRMTVREAILDSDGLYIFECKVNAAQMADTISFHFENDGEMVGTAYQTSVRTYAEYIIRADNNAALGVEYEEYVAIQYLMYAMLNYGAMAQNQTGYNTDNLADANLDPSYGDFKDKHKDLPDFSDAPTFTPAETWFEIEEPAGDEQPPFRFESVSIGLNSTTSMKFYFKTDDLSQYTFRLLYIEEFDNGAMYLIEESLAVYANKDGDGYFIEIVNIPACYLDHAYRIEVRDAGDQVFAVEATVLAYVQAQLENLENPENEPIDENLVNLMKAIYYYNQAANEYFGY